MAGKIEFSLLHLFLRLQVYLHIKSVCPPAERVGPLTSRHHSLINGLRACWVNPFSFFTILGCELEMLELDL